MRKVLLKFKSRTLEDLFCDVRTYHQKNMNRRYESKSVSKNYSRCFNYGERLSIIRTFTVYLFSPYLPTLFSTYRMEGFLCDKTLATALLQHSRTIVDF